MERSPKYCACHDKYKSCAEHDANTLHQLTKRLSTLLQTRETLSGNATPATQTRNTTCFDTFQKERLCSFPHGPEENKRIETRHVGASKRAFRARLPQFLTIGSFKIAVSARVFLRTWKICYLKIDVPCQASVQFHHMSQNAMPGTEFTPCDHFPQH